MKVLVTAASEHGATTELAAWIGAGLAANGVDAEVRKLEEIDDLDRYGAFVVGSAIYLGQWLKPARTFVEAHAGDLARRPTWLFSTGPIVGNPPPRDDPNAMRAGFVERLVETTHARGHKLFGGKLAKSNLNWREKIAVGCAHASDGDFRDRGAVDEWAATIAGQLQPN